MKQLHEADFEVFREMPKSHPVFLDIGANAGQSAISFMVACPGGSVVSFEPNLLFAEALAHVGTLIPRFSYHMSACGETDGQFMLIVPVVDGVPFSQEASLNAEHFELPWVKDRLASYGALVTFQQMDVTVHPIDGFSLSPDIVKIDAEGWELGVLRGMRNTLEAHHPMLLVENNDYVQVTAFLRGMGYAPYMYDQDAGVILPLDRATTNTLYLGSAHFGKFNPRYISGW